ncbi:MAG: DAHL domain-containing protein [Aliarcobacter sp.]|nr:DAHL domain-containing protein [Aliarcobacter sp.]
MNRNKKRFIKYLDPVLIFLFLFIIVSILFIYNLSSINNKIKNFNHYLNTISNIRILHNEFESFFDNKATFINYDKTIQKTNEIYSLIDEFNNEKFYKRFGNELRPNIELLDEKWNQKHEYLERFKSDNSAIVGSLNYIIELSKRIRITLNNSNDILLFDNSLINLIMLFVNNIEIEEDVIDENLKNLSSLSIKYDNFDFIFFNKKINSTVEKLTKLNTIKQEYVSIDMKSVLDSIESTLS